MSTYKRMGTKLVRRTGYYSAGMATIAHWCPACEQMHDFAVDQPFTNGARWTFDGNEQAPSFLPSMNIRIGPHPDNDEGKEGKIDVCHYFLKNGSIQFLGDCTHKMAGTVAALPDIPASALQYSTEES